MTGASPSTAPDPSGASLLASRGETVRLVAALLCPAALVAVAMFLLRNVEAAFLFYTLGGCVLGPRLLVGAKLFERGPGGYRFFPPPAERGAFYRRTLLLWLLFGPVLFVPYALLRPYLGDPRDYFLNLEAHGWVMGRLPLYTTLFLLFIPSLEEWWWRGQALPRCIARFGLRRGFAIATLAFASYHVLVLWRLVEPGSLLVRTVAITLAGLIWGLAAHRDRAWGGCWISHALGADLVIVLIFALFLT